MEKSLLAHLLAALLAFSASLARADSPSDPEPMSNNGKGALMMVGGAVLVPIGLVMTAANSIEKCDPEMPSYGPCSVDGPNSSMVTVGTGAAFAGVLLFLTGLFTVAAD